MAVEKILLVEDEENLRLLYGMDLEDNGFRTELANNGKQALEKLCIGRFDCIVTDLIMPEMDGFQLCKVLRESGINLPIIVYTSHQTPTGLDNYATKILQKSSNIEELVEYIKKL
ncbi:MAG: response regulator [Candidatus Nanoarchaeia archaeon]